MILLAVDPGTRSPGVALFQCATVVEARTFHRTDRGHLLAVDRVLVPDVEGDGERARDAAARIAAWYRRWQAGPPDVVAFEWPQVYTAAKSKGDPNDLIALSAVGVGVACLLGASRVVTYKPAEWIGQVPKTMPGRPGSRTLRRPPTLAESWSTPRAKLIARCLTPAEGLIAQHANNDGIDAIGIGCKFLGRFDDLRVFDGAKPG